MVVVTVVVMLIMVKSIYGDGDEKHMVMKSIWCDQRGRKAEDMWWSGYIWPLMLSFPKPDELFNVRDFHNSETYATHCHPLEIEIASAFLGIFLPEGEIAQNSH